MKRKVLRLIKEMPVTLVIIMINIVVFVLSELPDSGILYDFGLEGASVKSGEYYRMFTCMFLHFDIYHILCNMFVLAYMGRVLELHSGHWRMLLIYIFSGLAGSLTVVLVENEFILTLGASGAIFGILGAVLVSMIKEQDYSEIRTLIIGIALNLVVTFTGEDISIGGHLGGLIGGFVLGWFIIRRKADRR